MGSSDRAKWILSACLTPRFLLLVGVSLALFPSTAGDCVYQPASAHVLTCTVDSMTCSTYHLPAS